MENKRISPFAGLPVKLAGNFLDGKKKISEAINSPLRKIREVREQLLEKARGDGIIMSDHPGAGNIPSCCGVDGCSAVSGILSSDFVLGAAFAVEGLTAPSEKSQWDGPEFKALIHPENRHPDTKILANAVIDEKKIELAAESPHELVLFNGSYVSIFANIMETLPTALKLKDSATGKEFIAGLKSTIIAFGSLCKATDGAAIWSGISDKGTGSEYVSKLDISEICDDEMLFSVLLAPGESTSPIVKDAGELDTVNNLPIKDAAFASLRDRISAELSKTNVLFYRPFSWTPVFKVEMPQAVAGDKTRLMKLLGGIQNQCSTAGISKPYPIISAEAMIQCFMNAVPTFRGEIVTHIAGLQKDGIDDIFHALYGNI